MEFGRQNRDEVNNMRYTGPKNKLSRREGIDLGLKTPGSKSQASLLRRLNLIPGQHGGKRSRKKTDYGYQLREKQKVKRIYGVSETQMRIYFAKANRIVGNTADSLVKILESRLDNIVYRLGFAPTRAAARQLVSHGHIMVNNKKVTVASSQVKNSDVISFRKEASMKIPYILEYVNKKDHILADWLERKGPVGKIIGIPSIDIFTEDVNLQSVIEFYSR